MTTNMHTSIFIHMVIAAIISCIFYSQKIALAYAFLPPDAVSEHTMRLGGLLFLLITMINVSAWIKLSYPLTLQRVIVYLPQKSYVISLAVCCNIIVLVHYSFESLYYHSLNPIVYVLIVLISLMGVFGVIRVSVANTTFSVQDNTSPTGTLDTTLHSSAVSDSERSLPPMVSFAAATTSRKSDLADTWVTTNVTENVDTQKEKQT